MNELINNILQKLVFNLECRASSLKNGNQETAYHFWCHAQEDLSILDELIQEQENRKEVK